MCNKREGEDWDKVEAALADASHAGGLSKGYYQAASAALKRRRDECAQQQVAANELWQLLDNIDTLSDVCKGDLAAFARTALKQCERRHRFAASYDGHTLTWSWQTRPVGTDLRPSDGDAIAAEPHWLQLTFDLDAQTVSMPIGDWQRLLCGKLHLDEDRCAAADGVARCQNRRVSGELFCLAHKELTKAEALLDSDSTVAWLRRDHARLADTITRLTKLYEDATEECLACSDAEDETRQDCLGCDKHKRVPRGTQALAGGDGDALLSLAQEIAEALEIAETLEARCAELRLVVASVERLLVETDKRPDDYEPGKTTRGAAAAWEQMATAMLALSPETRRWLKQDGEGE